MTTVQHQSRDLRELTSAELDAVGGAWSIGSSGDGGISFEIGNYSGTVWTDGAAIGTTRNGQYQVTYYRW
ncbi:hypothetical protein EQ718_16730 (plasmid) [Paracoccus versutus]|uniref:Bacteriocin n=1 Tax=Paracoccus versutus TaxID=34007 RepID=A0AAQ0HG82_PARVE|nr:MULTISPECIES: hypothetical protein [Paracoccus]WGR61855.1 hypothetical protein E3U26_13870 [Paracoccus ferrooxidans]SFX68957.1 hypothetical protein SAMN04244548_01694 [Paracoccus pantotrophus]KGJ12107.1 hypothetical protein IT40_03390 [Paracoccus versutus]MBT0782735.1 hypothetical protein [Paracoccus sp. pheM1]REG44566.1 hypothetical protein ATH84_102235 [Paracoccus versutus]